MVWFYRQEDVAGISVLFGDSPHAYNADEALIDIPLTEITRIHGYGVGIIHKRVA
jgi:hypothetical protein